ncbi:MAG: hypothetical protein ABIO70_12175 [Pseudomonadota bacterium]
MSVEATAKAFSAFLQCDERELVLLAQYATPTDDRHAHEEALRALAAYVAKGEREIPAEVSADLTRALSERFGRLSALRAVFIAQ